MPDSAEGKSEKQTSMSDTEQIGTKTGMHLKEALKMQLDVQKLLHEQLEIQRQLQVRIEEQGKQLKQMFDLQQHKTTSIFESQKSTEPQEHQIANPALDPAEGLHPVAGEPEIQTGESDAEEFGTNSGLYLKELLQLQLDIQRRLHEQLEIQRTLQLNTAEQGDVLQGCTRIYS